MLVEQVPGTGIQPRVTRQRKVVGGVLAGTIEAEALGGFGYAVGNANRVASFTAASGGPVGRQSLFHLKQGADKRRRVFPIETHRLETVGLEQLGETFQPFPGAELCALFNSSAIGNHDGQNLPAVLSPPPARNQSLPRCSSAAPSDK